MLPRHIPPWITFHSQLLRCLDDGTLQRMYDTLRNLTRNAVEETTDRRLDGRSRDPAPRPERSPRVEIVLSAGGRIIVEGGVDVDTVLALARGLEGLQ